MPDHIHAVLEARRRASFAALLGAFARHHGFGELWLPVDEGVLTTRDKLHRAVRYGALNPCRPTHVAGREIVLVSDPLCWPWSTHRDVVGAVAEPWIDARRLFDALGWRGDLASWQRYVSTDRHVSPEGTPLPRVAPPSLEPAGDLIAVRNAALSAARAEPDAITRRGAARAIFVGLAYHRGFRRPAWLARRCGLHPRSIPRLAARCPPSWLAAGARCLGDARLQRRPFERDRDVGGQPRAHEGPLRARSP